MMGLLLACLIAYREREYNTVKQRIPRYHAICENKGFLYIKEEDNMAMPHNTVQNAERLRIAAQITAFFSKGGEIDTLPDYDQPKDHELDGDMKKVHSFCKVYFDANKKPPSRKRVSVELSMSAKKLGQYLLALDKIGKVQCNKHGVITGVN